MVILLSLAIGLLLGAIVWIWLGQIQHTSATTRLVAHVPAIQFEGESLANFRGWIESRRDMLETARSCDEETRELLENRVKLDQQLLEELTP